MEFRRQFWQLLAYYCYESTLKEEDEQNLVVNERANV